MQSGLSLDWFTSSHNMFWHDFDVIMAKLTHHCQFHAVTQCAFGVWQNLLFAPTFFKRLLKMTVSNNSCRNGRSIETSVGKHQLEKTRVINIHMPTAPIKYDAGMAINRRYQSALSVATPNSKKAGTSTASWPSSTPILKLIRLTMN